MPRLSDADRDMENFQTPNAFKFSGQQIGTLGATEYTLAPIAIDKSSSVSGSQGRLEKCVGEIVKACRKSPRCDNLMLRVTTFNQDLEEVRGFTELNNVNPGDFDNTIHPSGSTALNDATCESIEATLTYAKAMNKQDFTVNGILFVLTDGEENASTNTLTSVRQAMEKAVKGEILESFVSILVGVGVSGGTSKYLDTFHKDAGFTQYVEIDKADEKSLAKLAAFVSKSISSQSQSLGTGGPSKTLTF